MTIRLFALAPSVVFQGRINQPSGVSYPAKEFAYDGVTVGTYSVVYLNQTVLIGSTAGAFDLGITRVRKYPTSNTMYIGLSSQGVRRGEVTLTDNAYFTVVDSFEVFSKTPFIDADGNQYMDADLAYTDQNSSPPPMANAGPGFCGTIDPITELVTVTFDSANSYATATGETIASVLWEIGDGSLVSGTLADASIDVEFPAGFRFVTLTVADTAANEHKAHVPVFARDPADDDSIENFQITRHTITASGQELDIRLLEDLPEASYPDGTLVLLWQDEPQTPDDREHMLFIGWIASEDNDIEATDTGLLRDTTLHCVDVAGRMKALPGFSQVLTHTASPTKWSEYPSPHMDAMILFLLQWQTTALDLADFFQSGTGSTFTFAELYADGSNLWDQVDRKAQSLMPDYRLTANRAGQLKVLPDPMIAETADRVSTSQANITIDDWQALSFQQQRHPRTYWLRANAIQSGTSSPPPALFAIAPGNSPGQGAGESTVSENLAVSQTTLNQAAGHHYARLNAPQGMFSVTLPVSANSAYDPARMDWVTLTITAEVAAQRGLTFSEARFLLHQLDVRYQYGRGGVVRTNTLKLERETTGIPAVTFVPAVAEPVDDGDYNTPPAADLPSFDGGLSATPQNIALITDDGRFIRTSNFGSSPPTWTVNNSIQGSFSGTGMAWVVDPFSSLYRTGTGTVDGFYVTSSRIYKVTDVFGTPAATLLHTFAESITTSGGRWRSIACSFGRYEAVESDNPWIMAVSAYNSGITTRQGTWIIYSRDGGQTWSSEIQVSAFKPTGGFSARYWPVVWMSPRTPGYAIVVGKSQSGTIGGTQPYYTTDWGATWSVLTTPAVVTSPQVTTGGLAGGALYVPWEGNADENVIFHGYEVEQSSDWQRYLYKTTGASSVDVTPSAGNYGPRWGLFAVRAFDGDSNHMVAVLANSNNDDDILTESTALFTSTDAGLTWTSRLGPTTTAANAQYVAQAAFSGTDENVIFAYGNEGYIRLSTDGGANFTDKRGSMSFSGGEGILALVGGDA